MLEELLRQKDGLIRRYLDLQDTVDRFNEEIYRVCIEIEKLNLMIREEEQRATNRQVGLSREPEGV